MCKCHLFFPYRRQNMSENFENDSLKMKFLKSVAYITRKQINRFASKLFHKVLKYIIDT